MNIRYEASFERDLKTIKNKKLLKRIKAILDNIKSAENLKEIRNIRKLKGHETYHRIRMGDYRIGLEFVDETVILTRILHRKDIYKYFP